MTNRELLNIIEKIKKNGNVTLQDIAISIGKDRSYLSKLINSEEEKVITKALLRDFREVYPAYFPESHKSNTAINHNGTPLPGAITIADYKSEIEKRIAEIEARRRDAEAMYQDAKAEKERLLTVIETNLNAILASLGENREQIGHLQELTYTATKQLEDQRAEREKESQKEVPPPVSFPTKGKIANVPQQDGGKKHKGRS
jgi:hypothetical protein